MTPEIDQKPFAELIMLYAEKLGEMTDRLAAIEKEHAAQNVPIDAALKAQQAAMMTLEAALKGITSLKSHVLENDIGAVSVRVEELSKQAETALRGLDEKIETTHKAIETLAADTGRHLEAVHSARHELSQKREADVNAFAKALQEYRDKLEERAKYFADRIEAARKEFAEPKGFNPRGKFDPLGSYARLDVVELNGSSYISTEDENREQPTAKSKKWQTLARRGASPANGGGSTIEPASLQTLTDGATITWDLVNPSAEVTIAGARTMAFRNLRSGGTYVLYVQQGGGGSLSWPSSVVWQGGSTPTITSTIGKVDVVYLAARGAVLHASIGQNYAAS